MEQFILWLFGRLDVATIIVIGIWMWILSRNIHKDMEQMKRDSDEKFQKQQDRIDELYRFSTERIDEMYQLIIRMLEKKDK